jgi:hypothetical protein
LTAKGKFDKNKTYGNPDSSKHTKGKEKLLTEGNFVVRKKD